MKQTYIIAYVILLSGCGTQNGLSQALDREPRRSTTLLSSSEFLSRVRLFEEGYLALNAFPEMGTQPGSGSGTFSGMLAFDYSGDDRGTATSALDIQVDFGSGSVDGTASDFAFASVDSTAVVLSGSLAISGELQDGRLIADVHGALRGPTTGAYGELTGAGELQGSLRGLGTEPDGIVGTIDGAFSGSSTLTIEAGAFFADRQRP